MATSKQALRDLGTAIRVQRIAAGLSQADLGRRAGIVGKYVSEIERGTRDVPFSTLHAIVEDGLELGLEIRMATAPNRSRAAPPLPHGLEKLARAIAALPEEHHARMLAIIRLALELATDGSE